MQEAYLRVLARQKVGPRHARPLAGLRVAPVPLRAFDGLRALRSGELQGRDEERAFQAEQGTARRVRKKGRGLAGGVMNQPAGPTGKDSAIGRTDVLHRDQRRSGRAAGPSGGAGECQHASLAGGDRRRWIGAAGGRGKPPRRRSGRRQSGRRYSAIGAQAGPPRSVPPTGGPTRAAAATVRFPRRATGRDRPCKPGRPQAGNRDRQGRGTEGFRRTSSAWAHASPTPCFCIEVASW